MRGQGTESVMGVGVERGWPICTMYIFGVHFQAHFHESIPINCYDVPLHRTLSIVMGKSGMIKYLYLLINKYY